MLSLAFKEGSAVVITSPFANESLFVSFTYARGMLRVSSELFDEIIAEDEIYELPEKYRCKMMYLGSNIRTVPFEHRVSFDAPRSIVIDRESVYKKRLTRVRKHINRPY